MVEYQIGKIQAFGKQGKIKQSINGYILDIISLNSDSVQEVPRELRDIQASILRCILVPFSIHS